MREKLYTKWKGGLNRLCFLLMCFCWTTAQSWAVGEDVHLTIEMVRRMNLKLSTVIILLM